MKLLLCVMIFLMGLYNLNAQPRCRLLITEILFNPERDGYDYVELYNASDDIVDLSLYFLANRNSAGDVASLRRLSAGPLALKSRQYVVVTADQKWLSLKYKVPDTARVCEVSSLPSYPDDEGCVVVLNRSDSSVCDEVTYSQKWHYKLLDDKSGVALERISFLSDSQNSHSWASASSASGYGTPGYQNSQLVNNTSERNEVTFRPQSFSPDNNGIDDYTTVTITTSMNGAVANSVVFNATGRRVRHLLKNEILGPQNIFRWDGLDDYNKRCAPGLYILVTTIFNLRGGTKKFKNVVSLAYPTH